jgi:anti-sigma factor RsiW
MKEQISSQDWILLSSYLDGELNPREKSRVEALLENRPEIRDAYQSLVRTKHLLQHAPRRRVPRNFTLSAEYARQPRRAFRLIPALRLSSAVAALMSVFLVVAQLLLAFAPAMTRSASPDMALQSMQEDGLVMEMAPAAVEGTDNLEPPIIYWGGPPQPFTPKWFGWRRICTWMSRWTLRRRR